MLAKIRSILISGINLFIMLSVVPIAGAQAIANFDLPSQPIADSLRAVAEQTNTNVLFDRELVIGITAPALKTQSTAKAAIARLLEGSGLTSRFVDDKTAVLESSDETRVKKKTKNPDVAKPLPPDEQQQSSPSALKLEESSSSKIRLAKSQQNDVGEVANANRNTKESRPEVEEIVVTGSRLRRSSTEGPAPVTIFDEKRIQQLGVTNVADVLNYLPQQSFSFQERSTFAGTRTVQLRGLGIGTTLILLNGRRIGTSALTSGVGTYFDLNTIPLSAIERVEVLSGSASAVYGADAVGGVVNIILKNKIENPILEVYYGTAEGGAEERRASLILGSGTGRLRTSATFDAFDREILLGEDRDLFANQDYRRFGGTDRRLAFANPGNVTSLTSANLPTLPSRFAAVPVGSSGVGLTPADFAPTAGLRNLESFGRFSSVVPKTQRLSGSVIAEFDLTEGTTAFGELLYSNLKNTSEGNPPIASGTVPNTNPFNPFGVPVSVSYLFTDLEPVSIVNESEAVRLVAGMKGKVRTWDWEVSVVGSEEDATNRTLNDVDAARVRAALAAADPAQALNVFRDGPAGDPDLLATLIAAPRINRFESTMTQGSAFARGPVIRIPTGVAEAVAGAEIRTEKILLDSFTFVSTDRRISAVYSELLVPLLGSTSASSFGQTVSITLAGRYDHYSDFGGAFNPQYGLEWRPLSSILFRGTYGTSFRPPSLFELYRPSSMTSTSIVDVARGQSVPYTLVSGGNPDLEPEESTSATIGLVFTPKVWGTPRIDLTYWNIEQDLRVQTFGPSLVLANEALFPERVVRQPPSAADVAAGLPGSLVSVDATLVNFGQVKTSGIDLSLSSSFETPFGVVAPSLSATWTEEYRAANAPNTPAIERVNIANSQGTIPEWRGTATLSWQRGPLGMAATGRYVSSYDDATSAGVINGRRIGQRTLMDIQGNVDLGVAFDKSLSWLDDLVIRAGALNLLNESPQFAEVGGLIAIDGSQADVRERFVYVSISKTF